MSWTGWLAIAFLLFLLVFAVRLYGRFYPRPGFNWNRWVARTAIFAAISACLYVIPVFSLPLPFLPGFLSLHFDEIPIFIAGFAYGPFTAVAVTLIKTIIKLPFTSTLCVGELADFIFTLAFVLPATLIYKRWRNLKGVACGFIVSLVSQLAVSLLLNIYVMLPFYMYVMGLSYETILAMCQAVNPAVTDLGWPYALMCVLPLNVIKDLIVIVVTFVVYRSLHLVLRFAKK